MGRTRIHLRTAIRGFSLARFALSPDRKAELPKFLSGWKEIANYLDRGVRTVQRYEREMGLPVRRPAGKSRAAVIATKAELDAWVAASPYRDAFALLRPVANQSSFAADITRGLAEMRRLKNQMVELRSDLKRTVSDLRETIQSVQKESNPILRHKPYVSIADFDMNNKAVFDLLGGGIGGKPN
jgi:hypothetical protein